ncbi:hypothetical protein [Georgenia yuyongxinii]|uniref:Uncharacterized protein n=1 Tax=Georgenia yuyongxinii TaxID=2589797 RepID=A0A552WTU3_9MICO|nr:hypothetical protein [Georgenia yuyongxinii]TRW46136.1 hypothetical protein FJ693_06775 [Georgenia yuyongxinii]
MRTARRGNTWARVVLVAVGCLTVVFGASPAFVGEGTDESLLAATSGAGMGVLVIVTALLATASRPSRLAWMGLWYLPVFFVLHLVAFRAWVPDLPLLLLTTVTLLAIRPAVFAGAHHRRPAQDSRNGPSPVAAPAATARGSR